MLLGEPIELGDRTVRNRVISAPMERNYCTTDGRVTSHYREYLSRRAAGGVGLLFTEASYVRADGRGRPRQMGIHDDTMIPGLEALAADVHEHGALLGIELNHGGRTAQGAVSGFRPVAPSPVPCEVVGGEMPLELSQAGIRDLVSRYGEGARRAREAGVDVISIHAAHGYLIHQFMSHRTNHRDDTYAAPLRFLDEVIAAVRGSAPDLAVGVRISAFEGPPDGLSADETFDLVSACRLDDLDFIDVSAGSYEAGEWIVQPGEWEEGLLADHAERYRRLGLPVSVAGRIASPETAERLIREGRTDLVTLARALHADPQWTDRALRGARYRPCIGCNLCIDSLGEGAVPCTVNPAVDHDLPAPTLAEPRRVLIVGAGPAGLEAARRLGDGGCDVHVVERAARIGGQFALAATLDEYPGYGRILDWYADVLADSPAVTLELSTTAGRAYVEAHAPEVVLLAVGADGFVPAVPGVARDRVVEVRELLRAGLTADGHHLVWGADREGVAVADTLATAGAGVTIVGAQDELAPDVGRRAKILAVPRLTTNDRVRIELSARLTGIREASVVIRRGETSEEVPAPGPVIVSQGLTPATRLRTELAGLDVPVLTIGDAAGQGGSAARAILDGARVVERLDTGGGS